ncbi:MAG: hypothetical protein JJ974_07635 [Phycisphaerales bacterium]|nr:hypothetical protein [Phycisphaerales bacterium]
MYQFADEHHHQSTKEEDSGPIQSGDPALRIGDHGVIQEAAAGADVDQAPEVRPLNEFSIDLHGKSHPDALYRAAGGEARAHAGMVFGCPCCGRSVGRVLRVRASVRSAWVAMCAMCAASTLDRNPEAMIGGVVRASRRRRARGGEQERAAG